MTLLTPIASADEIGNWSAPPYWSPPVAASGTQGREALAGREPLGPAVSTALPFISLFPCRLVDTRAPAFPAPLGGGFLPAATVRSYTLTGVCNLPANAQAVSLNATVVHPIGPGFLTLYPQGGTFPPVSTLNYLGDDVIVNAAVVPLSASGGISMALGVSGGDVILDTNGYYAAVPSVTSLNTLTGDMSLAAGANVSIAPSGNILTIAAANSGGTVTSVGAGSGLTGGPITSSGSLSVAPLGITTGMLADNAVTAAKLAPGVPGTPYLGGHENAGAIVSGVGSIYGSPVNIGTSTKCMATTQAVVPVSVPLNGFASVYGTWRVNGTTTDHLFNPWCFLSGVSPGNSYYQCSNTGIVQPSGSATNTYNFGCLFNLPSTFTSSAYCHVTVICFP